MSPARAHERLRLQSSMTLRSEDPAARVPTIRDVARRAGVAMATVSNVLTGRRPVAEDRRRRVLEAVAALGYQPNLLASGLRRRRTATIGIVVPDLTNPFFAAMVQRIEGLAAAGGYQVLLVDSTNDPAREEERTRALLARRIDGLVFAPTEDALPPIRGLEPGGVPMVIVDRTIADGGYDTVLADNVDACERGCRHLLDLGHRDIALLVPRDHLANIRERIEGYRRALAAAGLAAREHVVIGGSDAESCRGALEPELRRRERPSAIFAAAYESTLGAIRAIRAVDLAFPDRIALLGFDDFDWMRVLRPYISTVAQPIDALGAEAWRLLSARLRGESAPPARLRLPCTLQIRESSPPPAR